MPIKQYVTITISLPGKPYSRTNPTSRPRSIVIPNAKAFRSVAPWAARPSQRRRRARIVAKFVAFDSGRASDAAPVSVSIFSSSTSAAESCVLRERYAITVCVCVVGNLFVYFGHRNVTRMRMCVHMSVCLLGLIAFSALPYSDTHSRKRMWYVKSGYIAAIARSAVTTN